MGASSRTPQLDAPEDAVTTTSRPRRTKREQDPVARRMLATVQRLEAAPWPAAKQAYRAMLVALASRCEDPAAKSEVYRWFKRAAGGSLVVHGPDHRDCLRDAFHEAVARIPGLLLQFRAGLTNDRRPNIQSMLVAWIRWRANDLYRSLYLRHRGRQSQGVDAMTHLASLPAYDNPEIAVIAADICGLLVSDGSPPSHALLIVAQEYTIAEAARLTGASRQQIYRERQRLKNITDPPADG